MTETKTLLVDCFEKALGTPEPEPYSEIVLYRTGEGLILEVYANGGTPEETCSIHQADPQTYEEVMTLIRRYDPASWNEREYPEFEGVRLVCRYRDGEELIRVSSENMPPEGERVLREIAAFLYGKIRDQRFE